MEYGILVVEDDSGQYQVISSVWSIAEARELIEGYFAHGHENGCIAPDTFVIHRRGPNGFYTVREPLEL